MLFQLSVFASAAYTDPYCFVYLAIQKKNLICKAVQRFNSLSIFLRGKPILAAIVLEIYNVCIMT